MAHRSGKYYYKSNYQPTTPATVFGALLAIILLPLMPFVWLIKWFKKR